jgi:hypothetical protein
MAANKFGKKPRAAKRKRLEVSVEQSCIDFAKAEGVMSRKMNGGGFRAWPDRCFFPKAEGWVPGVPVLWIEFKREGEDLTPAQAKLHGDLRERGQHVMTCWNIAQFKQALSAYLKEES